MSFAPHLTTTNAPVTIRMPRSTHLIAAAFFVGLIAGVYLQHRWPLGRVLDSIRHPAPVPTPVNIDPSRIASIPAPRRLVILVSGQSNAANYGSVRAKAGPGVYVFHDNQLFPAADPLPGADNRRGSVWTRLGARLMYTGDYEAIVFAVTARGSSTVENWAPGGALHPLLDSTLRQLSAAGLSPDFFLWHQGETEAWQAQASGARYAGALAELIRHVRSAAPGVISLAALSTYGAHTDGNAQIRAALAAAASLPGVLPGPDLDSLDAPYRSDGVHLNEAGLDAAADRWLAALRPALDAR